LLNPNLAQTDNVDWAGLAPNVLVRSASGYVSDPEGVSLGWSGDGGYNWHDLIAPPVSIGPGPSFRIDVDGQTPISVSADGKTFVISGPVLLATANRGNNWWRPRGLPQNVRAIADKTVPRVWYAVDYASAKIFVSRDGARSFREVPATGLPSDMSDSRPFSREIQRAVLPRPGTAGELWLITGGHLYRSTNFARSFSKIISNDPIFRDMLFVTFGLGKAAPGASFPAIYAFGIKPTFGGLYRSIDGGATWARINDDAHQWGLRYRAITGDPRVFGRVYVGTDGRGIFYGDPLH